MSDGKLKANAKRVIIVIEKNTVKFLSDKMTKILLYIYGKKCLSH